VSDTLGCILIDLLMWKWTALHFLASAWC